MGGRGKHKVAKKLKRSHLSEFKRKEMSKYHSSLKEKWEKKEGDN